MLPWNHRKRRHRRQKGPTCIPETVGDGSIIRSQNCLIWRQSSLNLSRLSFRWPAASLTSSEASTAMSGFKSASMKASGGGGSYALKSPNYNCMQVYKGILNTTGADWSTLRHQLTRMGTRPWLASSSASSIWPSPETGPIRDLLAPKPPGFSKGWDNTNEHCTHFTII